MGFDAVVVGSIASVVVAIIVVGVIAYKIVKQMGDGDKKD
jgi:hypothetical protein